MKILFCIFVINFLIHISTSKSVYQKIVDNIFEGYDPGLRPVIHPSRTTNVTFRFGLIQLLNVEEKEQKIEVVGFVEMSWFDEFLQWDPAAFDNVTRFRYPHEKVWKPEIILTNTPDHNDGPATVRASTNVIINADGYVNNSFIAIFSFTCRHLTLLEFPFDTHKCYMEFGSWTHGITEIDIFESTYIYDLPGSMKEVPSTEWDIKVHGYEKIKEVECCPNETYPYLRIHMTIKRKPVYYIVHLIVPTLVTCYVAFFGMFNPTSSSGDRADKAFLGLCTLFTFSLLLLTASSEMPVTSNAVTLLGMFLGVLVLVIAAAVIITSIIMNIHLRWQLGRPLSKWTRKWIVHGLGPWLWLNIPQESSYSFDENNVHQTKKLRKTTGTFIQSEKDEELSRLIEDKFAPINDIMANISENLKKEEYVQMVKDEWGLLCLVLDRICLIFFVLLTTVFAIVLFARYL